MKKFFAIPLLALNCSLAHAQVGEQRYDFAVGVNGGCVLNRISFNPTIKQTWKPGATFGLTARYVCEKYFNMICAVQAEVNFTQMGWREIIETSSDTYERTINYIQVPLLARLGFGRELRGAQGYLVLGPQIGFRMTDSDKRTGAWTSNEQHTGTLDLRPNNVTQQYDLPIQRSFDYGITGGLGVEFSTAIGHFMAEGRYYFGLSDIFNNGKKDAFGRSAHGAIVAKVTYLFGISKTQGAKRK
ncbi:MAG: PorT family protein [Bacteroidales bacterium]|nr:PorT family protein [Candidatus Physcousia equi]